MEADQGDDYTHLPDHGIFHDGSKDVTQLQNELYRRTLSQDLNRQGAVVLQGRSVDCEFKKFEVKQINMGDGGASVGDIILSGCGSDFDPEWASLPLLVVFLVLDKLLEPIDHVRFAAVCKEWSCLAKDYNRSTQRWSPMLMIPTQLAKSKQTLVYSVGEGKIYKNIQGIELPEPMPKTEIRDNRHCCSPGYGWLAIIDCYHVGSHHQVIITLLNPFSSSKAVPPSRISLPPLEVSDDILFFRLSPGRIVTPAKVVLSDDPALNPDGYAVIAFFPGDYHIFYTGARFTEEGRSIWRSYRRGLYQFYDAIFHKGLVYAADNLHWSIHSFDLHLVEEEFDNALSCYAAQPYYDSSHTIPIVNHML